MSSDQQQTEDYADSIVMECRRIAAALAAHDGETPVNEDWEPDPEGVELHEAINAWPLEIEVHNEWHATDTYDARVVVTTGGPHAELQRYRDNDWRVVVYWGGTEARRYSSAVSTVGEYYMGMFE